MASRRMVVASYTKSRLLWSSCLLVVLSAGAQGSSHPAESSKVCELDEGSMLWLLTHATQAPYVAMDGGIALRWMVCILSRSESDQQTVQPFKGTQGILGSRGQRESLSRWSFFLSSCRARSSLRRSSKRFVLDRLFPHVGDSASNLPQWNKTDAYQAANHAPL